MALSPGALVPWLCPILKGRMRSWGTSSSESGAEPGSEPSQMYTGFAAWSGSRGPSPREPAPDRQMPSCSVLSTRPHTAHTNLHLFPG